MGGGWVGGLVGGWWVGGWVVGGCPGGGPILLQAILSFVSKRIDRIWQWSDFFEFPELTPSYPGEFLKEFAAAPLPSLSWSAEPDSQVHFLCGFLCGSTDFLRHPSEDTDLAQKLSSSRRRSSKLRSVAGHRLLRHLILG